MYVKQVKDDQIEELTREIQMYYGIKRHIEELTKENQVFYKSEKGLRSSPRRTRYLLNLTRICLFLTLPELKEAVVLAEPWSKKHKTKSKSRSHITSCTLRKCK